MANADVDCFGQYLADKIVVSLLGIEEQTKPKRILKQLQSSGVAAVYSEVNRRLDPARFVAPAQTTYNESSPVENTDFLQCSGGIKDLRSTAGSLAD